MRPSIALSLCAAIACTPPAPTPPAGVRVVSVAAPVNRTGRDLVVSGRLDVAALLGRRPVTVMDVLAAELERRLRGAGFDVVAPDDRAAVLTLTIDRFDPDVPGLAYVAGGITATLVAPDGRRMWSFRRDAWTVPTPNAVDYGDAWAQAARSVAEQVVAGWTASTTAP